MDIKLSLNKNVNENAEIYFKKSKKLKSKIPGIEKTIAKTKIEIDEFEKQKESYLNKKQEKEKLEIHKKKEWYDKFRYTKISSGHLCVLGKDASSNEVLIKKYMQENDIVIHTEAPGSPFCIIKDAKGKLSKNEIIEAMQYTCCFSKQWAKGFGTADAFWVNPDQISKKALSGEYMSKGAFMIYGEKNIIKNIPLRICLGVIKNTIETQDDGIIEYEEIFSGVEESCKKYCKNRYIKIEPGKDTHKTLSKQIKKLLKITHLEDLPKYVPNNSKILKK